MRRSTIFFIGLSGIVLAVAITKWIVDLGHRHESFTPVVASKSALGSDVFGTGSSPEIPPTKCLSASDMSDALRKLEWDNQPEVNQARALLLKKSRASRACREEVITALMKDMDRPSLDFTNDKASYCLWLNGAEMLGELKASESLDLLISHLDLVNRSFFTTAMLHQPALRGVIKMGPTAIPKLDAALRHNPNPQLRYWAVYCIATIGGPSAVSSLKEAVDSERDECVKRSIRVSLDSFDRTGNIKDRLEWFSGISCNQ